MLIDVFSGKYEPTVGRLTDRLSPVTAQDGPHWSTEGLSDLRVFLTHSHIFKSAAGVWLGDEVFEGACMAASREEPLCLSLHLAGLSPQVRKRYLPASARSSRR